MSSIHHKFARNPPKTQPGWYCQACGYFTPRLDDKERALVCRRAAQNSGRSFQDMHACGPEDVVHFDS
jgi:hypothetical protein